MVHDFKKYPELTDTQMQFYYFESPHPQITEDFDAHVEKVHDGDTITITCDFRDFEFRVRLANINAPELGEGGEESGDWLRNMIEGQDIRVLINKDNRVGKYGRLIGEILCKGMNLNNTSMVLGYSKEFGSDDGKIKSIDEIINSEVEL